MYRGFDRALRRQVAVKLLHRGEGFEQQVACFEREVRLLARFQHSHLIPLYDVALDDAGRYLVMPFIRGTTLAQRIAYGPVRSEQAVRIGTALADALAYVHKRGVVHRDVKPSNVPLGRGGELFLADFGIAHSGESGRTPTVSGHLTGTPAYLAPEQVETGETVSACDVYALGLVLLEALTDVRAFPGTVLEQAVARLRRQPQIPPWLGPRWVGLIEAMTARDPAHRPHPAQIADLLRHPAGEHAAGSLVIFRRESWMPMRTPQVALARDAGRIGLPATVRHAYPTIPLGTCTAPVPSSVAWPPRGRGTSSGRSSSRRPTLHPDRSIMGRRAAAMSPPPAKKTTRRNHDR